MLKKTRSPEKRKKKTIATNTICIIISAILTLVLLMQFACRQAFVSTQADRYINKIDYSEIYIRNGDERINFPDYINKYYISKPDVSNDQILNVMEKSDLNDLITQKYHDLCQYILSESYKIPEITADEICSYLDENEKLIYNETGIRFKDDDHEALRSQLEGPLNSFKVELENSKSISRMKKFISPANIVLLFVILLITLVVWGFSYSKLHEKILPTLKMFGVAEVISSAIFLVFLGIIYNNPKIISGFYKPVDFSEFIRMQSLHSMFASFIPLILGIVLVIYGIFPFLSKASPNQKNVPVKTDEKTKADEEINITRIKDESTAPIPTESKVEEVIDKATETIEELPKEEPLKTSEDETSDTPNTTIENKDNEISEMPEINSNSAVPINGRKCPKCGKVNLSRNLFCSNCGALLK